MGEDARHWNRSLGARDAITGWPAVTLVGPGTAIKIFVDEVLTREDDSFRGGRISLKRVKAFTKRSDGVTYRDIIHYPTTNPEEFHVESVTTIEYLYDAAQYDRVIMVKLLW